MKMIHFVLDMCGYVVEIYKHTFRHFLTNTHW